MNPVDVEKARSIEEFVNNCLTESRLEQGLDYLQEMNFPLNEKSTGDFVRWVNNDIWKEESDTAEASGISRKDLGKPISSRAVKWYFSKL